jgi:ubiquitin carboxyl-terminal hydrolase 14
MSTFSVNVKWGKQKFENVDIDLNESPLTFKTQLFSLTGVLTERQKLMIGGATINDDEWSIKAKPKIKQGCTFMLMGSADELPAPPKEKTKFIEDMSELEAASALELPFGLRNFGNTCYMNATLQCLRAIPELSSVLDNYVRRDVPETDVIPHDLTANMNTLFNSLRVGEPNLSLMLFLKSLHTAVPHFSEKDDRGVFLQQDAHECWSSILTNLNITLTQQVRLHDVMSVHYNNYVHSFAVFTYHSFFWSEFYTTIFRFVF